MSFNDGGAIICFCVLVPFVVVGEVYLTGSFCYHLDTSANAWLDIDSVIAVCVSRKVLALQRLIDYINVLRHINTKRVVQCQNR